MRFVQIGPATSALFCAERATDPFVFYASTDVNCARSRDAQTACAYQIDANKAMARSDFGSPTSPYTSQGHKCTFSCMNKTIVFVTPRSVSHQDP